MEQNNLVVTPDGKTWDEVTRDVSYIGNVVMFTGGGTTQTANTDVEKFDVWRGQAYGDRHHFNKDFAIAYDRLICLRTGSYRVDMATLSTASRYGCSVYVNGALTYRGHGEVGSHHIGANIPLYFKKGDYIQVWGAWLGSNSHSHYSISRDLRK